MADGVRLATRLWRPRGEGPWPVLLMRQPYGRAIASTVTYAHPRWYAEQGFLVAVQDVRGRGDSEGEFLGFPGEARDGAATLRWARRMEGSNGRVGTYGFSYQGLTQLLNDPGAVSAGPAPGDQVPGEEGSGDPWPDALAPAHCGLNERTHWAGEGGAHWWAAGLGWGLQLAAEGCRRRGDMEGWQRIRRSLESGAFLQEGPELLERFDPHGMALGWLRRDPVDPRGWRRHRVADGLLRRPMLLFGGWHDPQLRGVLDLHRRARRAGGTPELRIGAWTHLDWRGGIDAEQVAFFRRHLSSSPAPERPQRTVRVQEIRGRRWRWAEAGVRPARPLWSLASEGLAAVNAEEGRLVAWGRQTAASGAPDPAPTVVVVHDPWRPVPGRGGHLGPEPALAERGDLDRRADVACFSSEVLETPLSLLGTPCLLLGVGADQPGFDLCAALSVVGAGGGSVTQLATGVLRVRGAGARAVRRRRLQLQALAVDLAAGERLRLSLAGAAWPQIAVNPGDGTLPMGGAGMAHRVITLTLALRGSRLWVTPLLREGSGAN